MKPTPPKMVRFLADEFHSESWSVSAERAREMAPENPGNSSYARAAGLLAERDFIVRRNTEGPLTHAVLARADVVALVHPCDPRWERTTSGNPPALSAEEIADLLAWVKAGGGLLVVSEYEHAKYGDNLNELLAAAGLRIENGKVMDRTACVLGNPEWIFAAPAEQSPLGHGVVQACFFRAGWLSAEPPGQVAWRASAQAYPPGAGVIGCAELGAGRVVVVTDSVLFGDERIEEGGHQRLWLNLVHWLAAPAYAKADDGHTGVRRKGRHRKSVAETLEWERVKGLVGTLRAIQHGDGSVEMPSHDGALKVVHAVVPELARLAAYFPQQAEYFAQLPQDLEAWASGGFGRPDFAASLALFHPERERHDGLEHLVLFPMYTPNASQEVRFEALIIRTFWPDWLADLERGAYPNPKFVPLQLVDFTAGYASECAVLFPETVAVAGKASNHFGGIFCDREAARLQSTAHRAAEATGLLLFPELECLLGNRELLLNVCALWDLIHDRGHALGELPFDPFMIRQRAPFWIYGLEELRVDLNAFVEADRLARQGFPFARYVCWAIVLDRIFRFPITGPRVRNYDALGGQLLFAALHQRDAIVWRDNRLTLHWDALPGAVEALRNEVLALYKLGADCSKVSFWMAAHELVARYLRPNVVSHWLSGGWPEESDLKAWLGRVHEDEFPLGNFHLNLMKRMR
jgi:hypothetical protein